MITNLAGTIQDKASSESKTVKYQHASDFCSCALNVENIRNRWFSLNEDLWYWFYLRTPDNGSLLPKYFPHLPEIHSRFMAFGGDSVKMLRLFNAKNFPAFLGPSGQSDQDRKTNRCHMLPTGGGQSQSCCLVFWCLGNTSASPRCPQNQPFASSRVLGVHMDWIVTLIFCLFLQFLKSQVGLMRWGGQY